MSLMDFNQALKNSDTYTKAKIIAMNQRVASISLIQRHLKLNYSYARNLIEKMVEDGIASKDIHSDGFRGIILNDVEREISLLETKITVIKR